MLVMRLENIDISGVLNVQIKQMLLFICSLVTRQVSSIERLCCFIFYFHTDF